MSGGHTETLVLTSSSTTGNQWFLGGTAIAGATNGTFSATAVGVYTVQVTVEGCASAKSNDFTVVITGVEPGQSGLKLFPNPASDQITVAIPGGRGGRILFTDPRGAEMVSIKSNKAQEDIEVKQWSRGIYFVTISTENGVYRTRFIKE